MRNNYLLLAPILLLFNFVTSAQNTDLDILSQSLKIDNNKQIAVFDQDVIVILGSIKLYTNKLEIYYHKNANADVSSSNFEQNIIKIIIPQKIKAIKQDEDTVIIANSAEFDNITKILTLIGDVMLYKDGNVIHTDELIYQSNLSAIKPKNHDAQ